MVLKELRREFSPEFTNRIDEVIVFNPLSTENLRGDLPAPARRRGRDDRHHGLRARRRRRGRRLAPLDVGAGRPNSGARPLRRTIQRHVEDAVSELLIGAREQLECLEVTVIDNELKVLSARPPRWPGRKAREPTPGQPAAPAGFGAPAPVGPPRPFWRWRCSLLRVRARPRPQPPTPAPSPSRDARLRPGGLRAARVAPRRSPPGGRPRPRRRRSSRHRRDRRPRRPDRDGRDRSASTSA